MRSASWVAESRAPTLSCPQAKKRQDAMASARIQHKRPKRVPCRNTSNLCRPVRLLIVGLLLSAIYCWPLKARSVQDAHTVQQFRFSIDPQTGQFALVEAKQRAVVFRGQMGVRLNGRWVYADNYPKHFITSNSLRDRLGSGREILIHNQGLTDLPELQEILQTYNHHPYVTIEAAVVNHGTKTVLVSDLRSLIVTGQPCINLGAPNSYDRVLSDTFGEGGIHIYSLDHGPNYRMLIQKLLGHAPNSHMEQTLGGSNSTHFFAVGDQLIYNLRSHYGIFFGALTSDRFITTFNLRASLPSANAGARILGFDADAAGTTQIQDYMALRDDPPDDRIVLRLPVRPGGELEAERIMIGAGRSFINLLENYGQAVQRLHRVDISASAPMGFWSWGAYKNGLTSGAALTNAQWLAQHLKHYGFKYFFMDDGWQYDRGEYTTANAILFPTGIGCIGHRVTRLGLNLGLWTAPFEVARRSLVYQHHPDWVVRNDTGQPIEVQSLRGKDPVYALDTTNPGAQKYLWHTFHVLSHNWGARFIKLDFMDTSAIEGDYYRPHTTAMEAQRIGLEIIRRAVGRNVLLDKDGSVTLNPVGLVDAGRISSDVGRGFTVVRRAASGIAAHFYEDRNFYISDSDSFSITKESVPASPPYWVEPHRPANSGLMPDNPNRPLTRNVARVAITLAAVTGGMYEIGDDLPALGREPYRLSLVLNPDLLDMVRLGRPAVPIDLMTYRHVDGQPSIFFLHEDARQAMLAVFNWTQNSLTHRISLQTLGLGTGFRAEDIFQHNERVSLEAGDISLTVPPQDVRVIKFVDNDLRPASPVVQMVAPTHLTVGQEGHFCAKTTGSRTPVVRWDWNFGDGVTGDGPSVEHAYTMDGAFTVTVKAEGLDSLDTLRRSQVTVSGAFDLRLHITRDRPWHSSVTPP